MNSIDAIKDMSFDVCLDYEDGLLTKLYSKAIVAYEYLEKNNLKGKVKLKKPTLLLMRLPTRVFDREIIWL